MELEFLKKKVDSNQENIINIFDKIISLESKIDSFCESLSKQKDSAFFNDSRWNKVIEEFDKKYVNKYRGVEILQIVPDGFAIDKIEEHHYKNIDYIQIVLKKI